ncbi:MAG: hypothetical protein KDJ29_17800 [Hyphomicrobiales bacterium]|nr:hypothetical protein [Hyphomicrobiales bacterium]
MKKVARTIRTASFTTFICLIGSFFSPLERSGRNRLNIVRKSGSGFARLPISDRKKAISLVFVLMRTAGERAGKWPTV